MSTHEAYQRLRPLQGQCFDYLARRWRLIEILPEQDSLVLMEDDRTAANAIQTDLYGQASRRAPQTLCLNISDASGNGYSEELIELLRGRFGESN